MRLKNKKRGGRGGGSWLQVEKSKNVLFSYLLPCLRSNPKIVVILVGERIDALPHIDFGLTLARVLGFSR